MKDPGAAMLWTPRPRCRALRSAALVVLLSGAGWLGTAEPAGAAGGRHALIIGNGAYEHLTALDNPALDAELLGTVLERRGFTADQVIDADYESMREAIDRFRRSAQDAEVALVYYAGHGIQVDGVNYLLPVSADIDAREDLRRESVVLPLLLHELEAAAPEVGILILDACRDNPIAELAASSDGGASRSLMPRKGLAPAESPTGLLIAYATAPGQVALDGPAGGNSPYAEALARYLDEPGLEIGIIFRKVSAAVREATANSQVPWIEASLTGEPLVLYPEPADESGDMIAALNRVLDETDPLKKRHALAQFVTAHADSPAAALAQAYFGQLEKTAAAKTLADSRHPEAVLADWQRVALLAGSPTESFATELFSELHGRLLSPVVTAAGRETAKAADDAAALLWPMVEASGRAEDHERYLGLYPETAKAAAATAGLELASLDLTPIPAEAAAAAAPALRRVTVVVGTGPVELPLPATDQPLVVVEPPRHGRLRAFAADGAELSISLRPVRPTQVVYEPPLVLRRGVDRLSLAALASAAEPPARKTRSLDREPEAGPAPARDKQGRVSPAAAPNPGDVGPAAAPALTDMLGERLTVQLEIVVDPCDHEAGFRYDSQGVVLGRFPEEIESRRAAEACRSAVERFPDVARFRFQLGMAIDQGGDPAAAVPHYRKAAGMGHWIAVNRLGFLYATGRGLPIDLDAAHAHFERAAANGDTHAMNNLARVYCFGEAVPADRERAIERLREAAARGNSFAFNGLGDILLDDGDGQGALPFFRQAASVGDAYNYNNLGYAYQNGIGVEADIETAIEWYERAAASGQPLAPINLGLLYRDGAPGMAADVRADGILVREGRRARQSVGFCPSGGPLCRRCHGRGPRSRDGGKAAGPRRLARSRERSLRRGAGLWRSGRRGARSLRRPAAQRHRRSRPARTHQGRLRSRPDRRPARAADGGGDRGLRGGERPNPARRTDTARPLGRTRAPPRRLSVAREENRG